MITLGVKDIKRAAAFYEKGLGWEKSSASMDDIAFFPLGGIILALCPIDSLAEDALVPAKRNGFSGITLSYNAISEKEVDDV